MPTDIIHNCTTRHCGNTNVSQGNDSLAISEETDMPLAEILKLTFVVFIALFGVIGNFLVTIVLRGLGKKKKPADLYIQNLAIADLGMLLLTFPLAAIRDNAPWNWPFGEFTCLYLYPVPEIFYGASVWFIAVISIERYRKIVTIKMPSQNKNKSSLLTAKFVAACVWVTSFLVFCLPLYFVVEYHVLPNGGKWCSPVLASWDRELVSARVYVAFLTFLSYMLPLVVISFTYLAISREINRSSWFIKTMKQEQHDTITAEYKRFTPLINLKRVRLRQNKRAKKILTPVVLVFAVTMLPLNILRLTAIFWPESDKQQYFKHLYYAVSVFVVLNSSLNPAIYSIFSRDFRKGIKNIGRQSGGISFFFRPCSLSLSRSSSRRQTQQLLPVHPV